MNNNLAVDVDSVESKEKGVGSQNTRLIGLKEGQGERSVAPVGVLTPASCNPEILYCT
jgi:hypothetical protein